VRVRLVRTASNARTGEQPAFSGPLAALGRQKTSCRGPV